MIERLLLPLAAAALASAAPPPAESGAGCQARIPADLPRPGRWLGPCVRGRAEGLGVLRTGKTQPYGFFAGRMAAGRPGQGMMIRPDGLFGPAAGFDAAGRALPTDSLHPEQEDRLFALAANAAEATAVRFSQTGNRASASYYRRLAARIRNSQPE